MVYYFVHMRVDIQRTEPVTVERNISFLQIPIGQKEIIRNRLRYLFHEYKDDEPDDDLEDDDWDDWDDEEDEDDYWDDENDDWDSKDSDWDDDDDGGDGI